MTTSIKQQKRNRRRARIRARITGTAERPRLSVWKGSRGLFLQLIDDTKDNTLVGVSDRDMSGKTKTQRAHAAGKKIAEQAKAKGITEAVFDRGGYIYIGRVRAAAQGAREGGLKL